VTTLCSWSPHQAPPWKRSSSPPVIWVPTSRRTLALRHSRPPWPPPRGPGSPPPTSSPAPWPATGPSPPPRTWAPSSPYEPAHRSPLFRRRCRCPTHHHHSKPPPPSQTPPLGQAGTAVREKSLISRLARPRSLALFSGSAAAGVLTRDQVLRTVMEASRWHGSVQWYIYDEPIYHKLTIYWIIFAFPKYFCSNNPVLDSLDTVVE